MSEELLTKYNPGFAPTDLPEDSLLVQWTGTAGFIFNYRDTTILIDPFMTRCGFPLLLSSALTTNMDLCALVFPKADAIMVGHSHYDHLLDVPFIAELTGASVYGSKSTSAVCRAFGIPISKTIDVEDRHEYKIKEVTTSFHPSNHGYAMMGRIPFPGEIPSNPRLPMRAKDYKHGGVYGIVLNFGGFRVCHFGSANLIDEELAKIGPVDLLLVGISGRQKTPRYMDRLSEALKPKYVFPHHYDNFFKPFQAGRIVFKGVDMDEFFTSCDRACPDSTLITPGFLQPVAFDTSSRTLITK